MFTMQTIASKYKKTQKARLCSLCGLQKAFDSVYRQALSLKLAKSGITGNFYNVLRNMYSNSNAYIKLSGHISNKFKIKKGTDLFKIFL